MGELFACLAFAVSAVALGVAGGDWVVRQRGVEVPAAPVELRLTADEWRSAEDHMATCAMAGTKGSAEWLACVRAGVK